MGALGLVALLSGTASASQRAALRPISGELSTPGYSVLGVAANGRLSLARVSGRRFTLVPAAASVALELRGPSGRYAGPIVVYSESKGARVIVGVKAGAKLGTIRIIASGGYAKLARRPAARWVDATRWARAKHGVPLGNGLNDGFVRSRPPSKGPPGDLDADGVPNVLDVDLNGNLVLNAFDRSGKAAARIASDQSVPTQVFGNPILDLQLPETVNANAPGLTDAQIEAALPTFGGLAAGITGITPDVGTPVELDCGDPDTGLAYCRQNNSTGTLETVTFGPYPGTEGAPFPSCCDANGNGWGDLTRVVPPGGVPIWYVPLRTHVATDQIGTGDVLLVHATIGGVAQEFSANLQFVYQTVPAVVSYDDGQGDSATLDYPVAADGPGTRDNPYPVQASPGGDVLVTLTFWKPQRPAIGTEASGWYDLGHTVYGANISDLGVQCPGDAYLDPSSTLSLTQVGFNLAPMLLDSSDDQPASPSDTLSFTVDLTKCLAAGGLSFNPGDEYGIDLQADPVAATPGGPPPKAVTQVFFRRQ